MTLLYNITTIIPLTVATDTNLLRSLFSAFTLVRSLIFHIGIDTVLKGVKEQEMRPNTIKDTTVEERVEPPHCLCTKSPFYLFI